MQGDETNVRPTWEQVKIYCDRNGKDFFELYPYIEYNETGKLVRAE